MKLKGSKTEANIQAAFQGESLARNKYSFFEDQARLEGNEEVAQMFERMASNEMRHAKLWYKILNDGIPGSAANIQEAAIGENSEWTSMYPRFAKTAREEGFEDIASFFEQVASIERDHEKTFLQAFAALKMKEKGQEMPKAAPKADQKEEVVYRCMFCGGVYKERPDVCTICGAIGSFEKGVR